MARQADNPITALYNTVMVSQDEVLSRAVEQVIGARDESPEAIKSSFSSYVQDIERVAYEVYLEEQERSGRHAIAQYLRLNIEAAQTRDAVVEVVVGSFDVFDRFFLSLSQARKARAGSTFEHIIRELFKKLNYPFDEHQLINGRPDFLLPSREHFNRNPIDCIIFTVKRTIRERWRQIVTEGTRGLGFFLGTIDTTKSSNELDEMLQHRIYLVVPTNVLSENEQYEAAENVIDFENFFRHHLDPAMVRWHRRNR